MKNYNKYFQLKMNIRDILIKYHLKCKATFDLMHHKGINYADYKYHINHFLSRFVTLHYI